MRRPATTDGSSLCYISSRVGPQVRVYCLLHRPCPAGWHLWDAPIRVGRVYSAQVSPRPHDRSRGRRRPAHRRGRIAEGSMLTDLRGFLALLEEQGDLVRITRPCSPEFEIAAGMRKTSDIDG